MNYIVTVQLDVVLASPLQREVNAAEGKQLADSWQCPFVEASARTNQNVNELFIEVVREMQLLQTVRHQRRGCCTLL